VQTLTDLYLPNRLSNFGLQLYTVLKYTGTNIADKVYISAWLACEIEAVALLEDYQNGQHRLMDLSVGDSGYADGAVCTI
jgi:hypothetical protein